MIIKGCLQWHSDLFPGREIIWIGTGRGSTQGHFLSSCVAHVRGLRDAGTRKLQNLCVETHLPELIGWGELQWHNRLARGTYTELIGWETLTESAAEPGLKPVLQSCFKSIFHMLENTVLSSALNLLMNFPSLDDS